MLPSRINLLSPDKKHRLTRLVYIQFSKHVLEIVLFFICIMSISLIGAEWILRSHVDSYKTEVSVVSNQISSLNETIQQINAAVNKTALVQKTYVPWTQNVSLLFQSVPENIMLDTISLDSDVDSISLTGTAPTRDDLLALEKQLETIEWITDIEIPLSQLTQKENIPFSLSASLVDNDTL